MTTKTKRSPLLRLVVPVIVTLALQLPLSASQITWCYYTIELRNGFRQLPGLLAVECSWPHTPPWSNFGIESPYGSRVDGHQFAGWHFTDSTHQWNACGSNANWDPPTCSFYNAADCTSQESNTDYVYEVYGPTIQGTCISQLEWQVLTVGSTYTDVWDLDNNWPDEYLGTLWFDETNVSVGECDHEWDVCWGESDWADATSAPSEFTSKHRVSFWATSTSGV